MTKKVRFGLVGCGGIGKIHADAIALLAEAELVAVCDVDIARASETAAKHGINQVYASAEAMLDAVELDAITVATDHKHHFVPAMAAIERGVNVIVEKPITVSLEEAHSLVEAAKARRVKLGGVFQRRFFPAAQRMHQAIAAGRIGRVTVAECIALLGRDRAYFARDAWRGTWKGEGGGALMNQAVHMIDMLLWMVGVPTEVYGRWATLKHGEYIDVEDSACAVVGFDNGALATITATTTLESIEKAPGFRIAVHGAAGFTLGMAETPELTQAITDQWPFDPESAVKEWAAAERGKPGFPGFHSDQLRDFAAAILEDREPTVTGLDAYRALEVIKAVYLSEARRRPIALPMSAADRTEVDRMTSGEES
ncbi:MAG TPA: Gfo/Idh/MocA family oxidoreductase [Roseiarcus sp.]|nr:Gfo/Idh/MocA family oxidoreductase [Roseiarcus sp.]